MRTEPWAMAAVLIGCIIGAFGAILLKKASGTFKFRLRSLLKNYNLIGGFLLYGIASLIFLPSLKAGELSVLYPLVGTTYMWVAVLSTRFLGEHLNRYKWFGLVFILLGVGLIGIGS